MRIAVLAVSLIVFALAAGECVWRIWDWPKRDPGWAGVVRLCTMNLMVGLALVSLASPGMVTA
jgi:hypothetical protein